MIKLITALLFFFCFFYRTGCSEEVHVALEEKFTLGNEILLGKIETYKNKRIALLTNQTGILSDGSHILDALVKSGADVVKIFSPEHGIRGDESYADIDEKTGIQIVSLYGGKTKPTRSDLAGVDIIIYDIQDVGARFYTYTSTLYNLIEAAAENNKKVIVCDRPVIIGANYVDGFMLNSAFSSFVGQIPAPVCYGMTCGELAIFLNKYVFGSKAEVEVMAMKNYTRNTEYTGLNLPWVKPSPSMFYPATALCYPATCFLEGTNVSEGRGTDKPFEYFGAPWMNSAVVASELNGYGLKGVKFETMLFTPTEKISAYPPKYFNKECNGVYINVTDKQLFEPVKCGVAILIALNKHQTEFKINKDNFIDKLAGTNELRKAIAEGKSLEDIIELWSAQSVDFKSKRETVLLYN
jgi:uncharacterized protein YbbC (DUF1343 family)